MFGETVNKGPKNSVLRNSWSGLLVSTMVGSMNKPRDLSYLPPVTMVNSGSTLACSIAAVILLKEASWITGPENPDSPSTEEVLVG
ncbi:hypothetical protein WICPIJ_001410 [Wickerhamomyces pijperi]|uniref:Uncharacterized protein n=1 Tax=Wickerhamomyces pijperi TaxID=599730 RepID=A0A9P8QDC9_WICPI|nr:hypothetical protein WICPIJ_001410 [Wickerhamomyces pijperi]